MVNNEFLEHLKEEHIIFMGSDWEFDPDNPEAKGIDHPLTGHVYKGEVPSVNCNDVFFWACSDGEEVRTEDDIVELKQAIAACEGDEALGAILYCARKKEFRPQGAMYAYIEQRFWPLFDECGPVRVTDFGNPYPHPIDGRGPLLPRIVDKLQWWWYLLTR